MESDVFGGFLVDLNTANIVILTSSLLIDRCCRLPVELRGALRRQLEEEDMQQDVQCLLQPLQLRAAGHRPGDTPPLPLL